MKKILLCSDGSAFAENTYRYGAWFANKLKAEEVDVLCVTDIRGQQTMSSQNLSGSIGIDASENLLDRLVELEHEKAKINHQRTKLVLKAAAQTLKAEGVERINLLHETGFLVDCLSEFEGSCDLIVLGKRGEAAEFASGHLGANLERVVRSSHKPCLVTSRQFKPIERVLIAYDGSPSCQKILQFIADSSVFAGLELHIVTVAKNATDQTAIARLESAKQLLQETGFEPVCSVREGHSEKVISNYVTEQDISLLLMGAYGHSRIRHLVIGSTTAQMLRSSHIPVLLFRDNPHP
ncbi:universal stress protein UspA-like protein [Xenococcus sp. PCC 7305]|uniref:universal stress protein n=1 Tax=Xenococcus sp. PCC 7305 TaxID=102125 RepID=UPI0002AC90CB|nr:universal stress protein [Xenococcus sp. PCC 7305]ELS01829.1 universal stress protein UspA-like protein [Xenococcus sp. PCC 7305]